MSIAYYFGGKIKKGGDENENYEMESIQRIT